MNDLNTKVAEHNPEHSGRFIDLTYALSSKKNSSPAQYLHARTELLKEIAITCEYPTGSMPEIGHRYPIGTKCALIYRLYRMDRDWIKNTLTKKDVIDCSFLEIPFLILCEASETEILKQLCSLDSYRERHGLKERYSDTSAGLSTVETDILGEIIEIDSRYWTDVANLPVTTRDNLKEHAHEMYFDEYRQKYDCKPPVPPDAEKISAILHQSLKVLINLSESQQNFKTEKTKI